jgi:hypothetical protein
LYKIVTFGFKFVSAPKQALRLKKTWDGEVTSPPPLTFDTRWTSLFILFEAVPISDPVCSGVDIVVKRKFADTVGN